jgi:hypothetical protein
LWTRGLVCAAAWLALGGLSAGAAAQAVEEADASALRLTWQGPDHASGIYHVKDEGSVTVYVDNPGNTPAELSGEIVFGNRLDTANAPTSPPAPAAADADDSRFKILSVTPIASATLQAGQRAKIPLKLPFGAAGTYELRWRHAGEMTPIMADMPEWELQCIFAPRTAAVPAGAGGGGAQAKIAEEAPWVTLLPRPAVGHPGLLMDYAQQTTVRRFVIDERFLFNAAKGVGLGFGASTEGSAKEIDAMLAEAASARLKCILRVSIPPARDEGAANARIVAGFREYIADAVRRCKGSLAGIVIVPEAAPTESQRRHFAAVYLAGYEAAKRIDRNVAFLGAGSAALTEEWLGDPKLSVYIDALAIADAASEPAQAKKILQGAKKPLYLLPRAAGDVIKLPTPAAAGLAGGASWVPAPAPSVDHGVTAHLLSGTVFAQRLHITVPTANPNEPESSLIPFVAVFQGDGYSVAAIAGFDAGTDLDGLYPGLAHTRTQVEPIKPDDLPPPAARPNLQIGDDTRSMRVVDSSGAPVDCRVGDNLFVPAEGEMMYVLQGGSAAELAGSLRVATPNRLPVFEIAVRQTAEGVSVRLHNVSTKETAGMLRLIRVAGGAAGVSAEKEFVAISPDKTLEVPLTLTPEELAALGSPLVVEVRTLGNKGIVQRTAVGVNVENPRVE